MGANVCADEGQVLTLAIFLSSSPPFLGLSELLNPEPMDSASLDQAALELIEICLPLLLLGLKEPPCLAHVQEVLLTATHLSSSTQIKMKAIKRLFWLF